MALLARQEISQAGLNPTFAAASSGAGDSFPNDDRTIFVVKNADASPKVATIAVQTATAKLDRYGTITFPALAVTIPAGQERWIKVPQAPYNNASGRAVVTYDAVASVTVAAVRMPPG